MADINDVLRVVSEWLNDIKKEVDEDMKNNDVNPRSKERLARILGLYSAVNKEDTVKLGDSIASNGGAQIFTEYIRMLTDSGKRDPPVGSDRSQILSIVQSLCWNYSHVSLNFCFELAKAGLFVFLVTHLRRCKDSLEEAQVVDEHEFVLPSLATLHNCAKDARARRYLAQAKVADVLPPYIRLKNKHLILSKIVAILISSYPIEEGHSEKPVDSAMLYVIVFYLENAVSDSNHKHLGFSAEELVDGLRRLADNDLNKVSILNAGVLPLIEKLLETGDVAEKTIAAFTLWSLCFAEENKPKVSAERKIMTSLQKLGKQPGELGHLTSGAHWFLTQQGRPSAPSQAGRSVPNRSGAFGPPKDKHIMISYSSRDKILALKIKGRLENSGHRVWMDVDSNEGKNFEAMKEALEKSELIIICVSQDYKTQPSCRMEAEYARKMKIPIIPILAEPDYKMSGWLRAMLDCEAFVDFSGSASFEKVFRSLMRKIGDKGKAEFDKTRPLEPTTTPYQSKIHHPYEDKTSLETPIETWTTNQVMTWATQNKLAPGRFHNVDGESLVYLRDMKRNSPGFYHKYVVEKLEISELQDLKNLSRGLENLKL